MIIVKGAARTDGAQLGRYLLSKGGNTGTTLIGMTGMAGRDLPHALAMAQAAAEQGRGEKPFWHAQINPAEGVCLTLEQQLMAVEILERHLGLQGQPRVVVAHAKDGREHVHVAWSRYDARTGKLVRDDFTHRKNVAAAAEIAARLGLEPNENPFRDEARQREDLTREERRKRSKAPDSQPEQQQDKRSHKTRAARKAEISGLWHGSATGRELRSALDAAGYTLARGWRGFVVIDERGEAHSLSRQIDGVRAKDVRSRLADIDPGSILPAREIKAAMRQARADRLRETARAAAETVAPDAFELAEGHGRRAGPSRPSVTENPSSSERPLPGNGGAGGSAVPSSEQHRTAADILAALTRHHSTFTRQDMARLIDKETGGGGHEPWMMKSGGLDALEGDARASAERSYAAWAAENTELAGRIGIVRYVAYVQSRQAARDAAHPENTKARKDNAAAFERLMAEVDGSPNLIRLGPDRNGRERFTSRDMLETELRLEAAVVSLAARKGHAVSRRVRDAVPGLDQLGDQQRSAFQHVLGAGDVKAVIGLAGTGKSRMLGDAAQALEAAGYRVRGAALSGIAAESLETGANIDSRTLHSLLHQLGTVEAREAKIVEVDAALAALHAPAHPGRAGRSIARERAALTEKRADLASQLAAVRLTERDVVVLDEAGMVDSRTMERLLSEVSKAGAKIILVGDQEQLQAVEAGAAFRAIVDRIGAADISDVRRQREKWQREATREFGQSRTADALRRYRDAGMSHAAATGDQAKADIVAAWTTTRQAMPDASQIILAYTRKDVGELNQRARDAFRAEGRLGSDVLLETNAGQQSFASGDRLYFTKNDRRLGVKNGTLGSIDRIEGDQVTVRLDTGRAVAFDVRDYGHITHGYAATVHKSQGVTVDRAHILASRYMDRHAAYVGMSRHRDRADLYYGLDEFKTWNSLELRLSRDGRKDSTLDYLARASNHHGHDGIASWIAAVRSGRAGERPPPPVTPPANAPASPVPEPESERDSRLRRAKRLLRQAAGDLQRGRERGNTLD